MVAIARRHGFGAQASEVGAGVGLRVALAPHMLAAQDARQKALLLLWRMGKEGSTARGGDMREMVGNVREWIERRMRSVHLLRERRTEA